MLSNQYTTFFHHWPWLHDRPPSALPGTNLSPTLPTILCTKQLDTTFPSCEFDCAPSRPPHCCQNMKVLAWPSRPFKIGPPVYAARFTSLPLLYHSSTSLSLFWNKFICSRCPTISAWLFFLTLQISA